MQALHTGEIHAGEIRVGKNALQASQTTRQRGEVKYVLDQSQYGKLIELISPHVEPDAHPYSQISSVYFDTPNNRIIRRSIEKPAYREKIRARSYGLSLGQDDGCYLEVKKKFEGIVYKRRVHMTFGEALAYCDRGVYPCDSLELLDAVQYSRALYTLHELDQCLKRYGRLEPGIAVSYNRYSVKERDNISLRITFDQNIRWGRGAQCIAQAHCMHPLLSKNILIMEIKAAQAMPYWLVKKLAGLKIYPCSFSKIRSCYHSWLQASQ